MKTALSLQAGARCPCPGMLLLPHKMNKNRIHVHPLPSVPTDPNQMTGRPVAKQELKNPSKSPTKTGKNDFLRTVHLSSLQDPADVPFDPYLYNFHKTTVRKPDGAPEKTDGHPVRWAQCVDDNMGSRLIDNFFLG